MYLQFAWRYFNAKKSTNAINIIAWVSMVAIVFITASFIVVLSVFNGFEGLVKSLYSSFYTDLRISPVLGKVLTISSEQLKKLSAVKGIRDYSLVVEEKTLLQNGDIQTIVYLKGVDDHYKNVTAVPSKMIRGKFDLGTSDEPGIVLGSGIENAIGVQSDRSVFPLTAYLFKPGVNINVVDPYQAFSAENIATTGTFFIQQDIDNKYALTNVDFMKRMLSLKEDEFGSLEISLVNPEEADRLKKEVKNIFGPSYIIETRYEQNKGLYSVMTLEKWGIYGILTLMLIVAAFTMIGALTMLIFEKQKDIQVLKAMGATNRFIQKIFISEGILLASLGTIGGMILAIIICWAQVQLKLIAIQGGTFLIDYYPVKMVPGDFLLVVMTVAVVAIVASWFPARKAAMQPIELKS
ncbi:MAG: ABC transporter permease [Chitinophagaceae bacterium]|nr:ABC transporter permease [Chitinophagaceae bacterium]